MGVKGMGWLIIALALGACTFQVGDLQIEVGRVEGDETPQIYIIERTVPRAGVQQAEVNILIGAGVLRLGPGAQELLEAQFQVDDPQRAPELNETRVAGRLSLELRQPAEDLVGTRTRFNRWDLRLNPQVPILLSLQMGAGEALIDVRGLNLTGLKVDFGAGKATIDLRGQWTRDLAMDIKRGVGELTVLLPKEVGVRVSAMPGVGVLTLQGLTRQGEYYVNQAYGQADVTLDIDLLGAVGTLTLSVQE